MSNFDERTNECAFVGGDLSLDQRRARFTAEISRYVGQIRVEDALDLEEFKQLSTTQKFLAMRNSVLAGDVRWSRENPTADIALAVRNLINFISDMHDGCCWISTQRIGELYGRDERTIRRYLQRLLAASLIKRVERPGRSQGYFPLIDRALVDLSASPTWFVDAFSPAPRRVGRPSKRGIHNTVNSENPGHLTPGLVRKPGTPDAGVSRKTPDTSCKNPGHRCPPESSFGVKEEEEEERRRDPASNLSVGEGARQNGGALSTTDCDLIISETLDDFCHEWVRVEGQERSDKHAESDLRRQIGACGEGRPEMMVLAIKRALIAMANKEIRRGAFSAYFGQALRTKVKDAKRDTIDLLGAAQMASTKVQVEQEIGKRRVTALDSKIAASTARRDASTMNAGTTRFHGSQPLDGRFDPSAKLTTIGFVPVTGRDANLVIEACPSATCDDVYKALVRVSADPTKSTNYHSGETTPIQIADVIERATTYAKEAVAHREHGTPEDLAGGPAAEDGCGSKMKACGYALSGDFVKRLLSDYPDAERARVATGHNWNLIHERFIGAAFENSQKGAYCRNTQKAIEADVERALKELDEDGKRNVRERTEAKEQLRHCASTR